mgnify:CR=1 FL=1
MSSGVQYNGDFQGGVTAENMCARNIRELSVRVERPSLSPLLLRALSLSLLSPPTCSLSLSPLSLDHDDHDDDDDDES